MLRCIEGSRPSACYAYRANTGNPFPVTGGVYYAGGDSVGTPVGVTEEL